MEVFFKSLWRTIKTIQRGILKIQPNYSCLLQSTTKLNVMEVLLKLSTNLPGFQTYCMYF